MCTESQELKRVMLALSTKLDRAITATGHNCSITQFPQALESGLVFDPTGTNSENHITNETHDPKSFGLLRIIWPVAGCFYGTTMEVYHAGHLLKYGVDYLFCGDHRDKYEIDNIFSGICLLHDHLEPITLDYQAVGRQINDNMISDIESLVTKLKEKDGVLTELHNELDKYNTIKKDSFIYTLEGKKGAWYTFAEIRVYQPDRPVWFYFNITIGDTTYEVKLTLDIHGVVKLKSMGDVDPTSVEPGVLPKFCIRALWDERNITDGFCGIIQIRVSTEDTKLFIENKNTATAMLFKPIHGKLYIAQPKPLLPNMTRLDLTKDYAKGSCLPIAKNRLITLMDTSISVGTEVAVEHVYLDKDILFDPRCTLNLIITINYGTFSQTEVLDHKLSLTELVGSIDLYKGEGKLRYAIYSTKSGWRLDLVRDGGSNTIMVSKVVAQTI